VENEEKVIDAFNKAGVPMNAKGITELTGMDKKEVDKIIKKLKKEEKIRSPKKCFYEPV
jgi:transcription initiation factor IIE alpha subunit